ncbi:MAG: hypothetical protein J0I09_04165 [Sphingobacteriia bacterium]|nr:hypothetical protein [Sphingobacteriia bacterium]
MRKLISFVCALLFFASIISCTRNTVYIPGNGMPAGVWVENSLRLDTLDFDSFPKDTAALYPKVIFKSRPFIDLTINPTYPVNSSTIYSYYYKNDSVYLYSTLSSYFAFKPYHFQLNGSNSSFRVEKFYTRTGLNQSFLTFEKIK